MISVAIPFVRVDASQNPNISVTATDDPAEPYFQTMTVAFASIRRWNPDANLELITNASPPVRYASLFAELGVTTRIVPFNHQPPHGFSKRFTASLFLLDALADLRKTTLIVDPDVLCIRSLEQMISRSAGKLGALRMDFPESEDINGLTRQQAGELHGLLGEPDPAPAHYGGEAYLIPIEYRSNVLTRVDQAWALTLSQHHAGAPKFTTEEHILSYALRAFDVTNLDRDIKRIWTTHRYRTVDRTEDQLSLWHLPAEKDRGFLELFPYATDRDSWFWNATWEQFTLTAGKAMGLHGRRLPRLALDTIGWTIRRLEDSAKGLRAKFEH
ncbi:UNVERIFIED_ORG: hypothetical protein J2X79_002530 [Arthrobacter globiformis]|nr:hypothetical protein [Arthrobacter globiformis]